MESDATRAGLSSVTRGTMIMMIGTLGWVGENFLSRVLLFRTLTLPEVSEFSIGITVAALITGLGTLGLPQAVARNLPFAKSDAERRAIVRTAFLVVAPVAVFLGLALFLASYPIGTTYHLPLLAITLQFFAIAAATQILSSLVAAVFQGYEDVLPNALFVQILSPLLFIVFYLSATGVTPWHPPYVAALAAYAGANAVTLAALLAYTQWKLPRVLPPGAAASGVSRKLLLFAMPLMIVSVLTYSTGSADTLVLSLYRNSTIATYTAPLTLARLLLVSYAALAYIFLPVTSRFVREGDHASLMTVYGTATKWMVVISLPLFLLFFFLPGGSLKFVFGPAYANATLPLQILVLGAFAATLIGPAAAAQVAFGQTRLLLYNTAVASGVDIGLSFALIPSYGLTGAAVAWATSNALFPLLSMAEIAALEGIHPFVPHFVVPLALTSVPLALLFAFVPIHAPLWFLPVLVLLIGGAYVLVVLLTGSVDRGDRLLLEVVESLIGRPLTSVRRVGAWLLPRRRLVEAG